MSKLTDHTADGVLFRSQSISHKGAAGNTKQSRRTPVPIPDIEGCYRSDSKSPGIVLASRVCRQGVYLYRKICECGLECNRYCAITAGMCKDESVHSSEEVQLASALRFSIGNAT